MEVLFVSDTGENNQASCSAWDYRTGTNMMNYKGGGNLNNHCFSILQNHYIMSASSTKPLMFVWPINSQELVTSVRFVMPGKVNSFALSPDGLYLVAGIQESFYIWHLNSGKMINTISKHYQPINCIKFIDDASHFITASKDGSVLVWNLTKLLIKEIDCDRPLYSFTDHGLPVTDIFLGKGGMASFLYTVSLDRTCKIYDLTSGILLTNVVFPEALHSIVVNALESIVYVGTEEGNIYEFCIDALPRTKECNVAEEHLNKFTGHEKNTKVTCLTLSLDGQTLISGGEGGNAYIWYIPSRQLLNKLPFKGQITNLRLRLSNPEIFQPEHKHPQIYFKNLKRMVEPDLDDDNEVMEIMVTGDSRFIDEDLEKFRQENVSYTTSTMEKDNSEQEDKIAKLEEEIKRLKQINKEIFDLSVKTILRNNKKKEDSSEQPD